MSNKTQNRPSRLALGMAVYAVIFLVLLAVGLNWFWDYMDAYERSRPLTAMNAFMATLDQSKIPDQAVDIYEKVDHELQTWEECRAYVAETLKGEITYARNVKKCTEEKSVYTLLCGKQAIGEVTLAALAADQYGFTPWEVTGIAYDFSYVLKDLRTFTATIPEDYTVFINGRPLNAGHIIEKDIPFDLLKDYYDSYDLPTMTTYRSGPVLGTVTMSYENERGEAINQLESIDQEAYLNSCTAQEIAELDDIVNKFVKSYVDFSSRNGGDSYDNYDAMEKYMVPDGELAKRMYEAIAGLSWVSDRGAKINSLTINHRIPLSDGRYLCDVTYVVDTKNYSGEIQTVSNVKLVIRDMDTGMKVEAMQAY